MKSLRNSVQLIGNLGLDPETKELNNGKKMVKFSLATNETYIDADGKKVTNTQWHHLIAWGNNAKIAGQYLKKGHEVAIEGKLVHRNYDDKDGNTHYITEIVVNEIVLLSNRRN
jgi:single-strand DNA-binding protein